MPTSPSGNSSPRSGSGRGRFDPETRIARWVSAVLEDVNMPQLDLANRSKVSQAYIYGILFKSRLPSDAKAVKLARALRREPRELLLLLCLDRVDAVLAAADRAVQGDLAPVYDAVKRVERRALAEG